MNELKIEKGIPLKKARWSDGPTKVLLEAFSKLEIGDSFLWDGKSRDVYRPAKEVGIEITTRKQDGTGCRVWRVK